MERKWFPKRGRKEDQVLKMPWSSRNTPHASPVSRRKLEFEGQMGLDNVDDQVEASGFDGAPRSAGTGHAEWRAPIESRRRLLD